MEVWTESRSIASVIETTYRDYAVSLYPSGGFPRPDRGDGAGPLNKVTSIPATYVPPPSANDPAYATAWAEKIEAPGGMVDISRDIKTVEMTFDNDRSTLQRNDREARSKEREQQQARESGEQPGAPGDAAPGKGELQAGGDPGVAAPPSRPASAVQGQAQAQTQAQTQEPDRETTPAH